MKHRSIGYRLWKHLNKKYGGGNGVPVTKDIIMSGGGAANDCNGYQITGNNNRIIVVENGVERELGQNERIDGLNINIVGNGNIIKINLGTFFCAGIDISSDENYVSIGKQYRALFKLEFWVGGNQKFIWDDGIGSLRHARFFMCQQGSSIHIHKDCLLSDVTIWSSDAHCIFDGNNNRLNAEPSHVEIGEHSWLAMETFLTKNAVLPPNTIVGARAVVSKKFTEEFTCLAGNPAKIIKRGIHWS